jgi:hypothetical protein
MKKSAVVSSLCALLLVGCACPPRLPQTFEQRSNPQVALEGSQINVSPDPMVFVPGEKGTITWHLPKGAGLRFAQNGIEINGRISDSAPKGCDNCVALERQDEIIKCQPKGEDRQTFTCENQHTRPGLYKYTIRVLRGDSQTPVVRDPTIMNM